MKKSFVKNNQYSWKSGNELADNIFFWQSFGFNEDDVKKYSTDGIVKGTLFEFKNIISDLNKVLNQSIIYLSKIRNKGGVPIPTKIALVDISTDTIYVYDAKKFVDMIQINYSESASKLSDNNILLGNTDTLDVFEIDVKNLNNPKNSKLFELFEVDEYLKFNVDFPSILGWAKYIYQENKDITKTEMFEILKKPEKTILEKYILGLNGDENDYSNIMDLLNDNINKAELGAFYTPDLYSKKALEYVREAIKKVPKNMDYIILDRCAGTGNLQKFMTKEELSHVIINTYEVKEWLVLYDKFYDKVRGIIPPAENVKNHRGNLVFGGDALTEEFITSTIETNYKYKTLQEYIEDKSVVIIGLENPPYSEENARNQEKSKNNLDTLFYKNHIKDLMKNSGINGNYTKDLANQFIWSYIYFFMRNKYDSYIVFSPIKYWKSANICNKKFIKGFIANRGNFKASESAICVCYWQNIDDFETNNINLDVLEIRDFDKKYTTGKSDKAIKIPNTATLKKIDNVNVEKVYKTLSEFYSKKLEEDLPSEISLDYKGYEREQYKNKNYGKVVYNKNILGILEASGFGLTAQDVRLVRTALYHGYGSYIRDFNYHEQLPLFVTKNFIKEKWYEDGLYYSTADGGGYI